MSSQLNFYENSNNNNNGNNYIGNRLKNFKQALPPPLPNQSNQLPLIRSLLFSKLTFNLSKGHFMFVTELLKTRSENQQCIGIEANANEIATNSQMWLQLETNKINKKFLNGKTPLIICSYIRENDWCMSLTRLLLENGAYLSLKDTTNGCNPLHYACALLKCDQIELYIKNVDSSLHSLRDFNGNTPLVYFLISFSFYFNRISTPMNYYYKINKTQSNNTNITNAYEQMSDEIYLEDEIYTARNNNNNNNSLENTDRIYESIESFQFKLVITLKFYLDYLKKSNLNVNTVNRLGYSLLDFYMILVNNNKKLERQEFFQVIKQAILDEERNIKNNNNNNNSKLIEQNNPTSKPKSSQFSVSQMTTKSSFLTGSQSLNNIMPNNMNNFILSNKTNRPQNNTTNELSKPFTYKMNLETFLKQNILINLNDMKINKLISHSKKVDQNLLYLFLNKQIGGKYFKSNSISRIGGLNDNNINKNTCNGYNPNNTPKRSTAMEKFSLIDEHSFSNINFRSLENDNNNNLPDIELNTNSIDYSNMNNWRDSIQKFYDYLNIRESSSFRKGCKLIYDSYDKVQLGNSINLKNNNNKIVSSSQNFAKTSKTQLSKSLSVTSSVGNNTKSVAK